VDLAGGHYRQYDASWYLNGSPSYPLREAFPRWAAGTSGTVTSGTMFVVPLVVEPGDQIGAVSVLVKTATATPTHGWVALYDAFTTAGKLLYQSADDTSGLHGSAAAWKGALSAVYYAPGDEPKTIAVAVFNEGATGALLDGMAGFDVAGGVTGSQLSLVSTVGSVTGATAPSTLAGLAAATGFVPYVACTQS
jgi:hypothetical protein